MGKLRKVFVYGTLKRGMSNSQYIPDYTIEKIQKGTTKGTLYYINSGAYPCLMKEGSKIVHGELYDIKHKYWKQVLEQMDILEGCPTLYRRRIVDIKTENGTEKAWTYIFNLPEFLGEEIENGIFEGPKKIDWYEYFVNKYGVDCLNHSENEITEQLQDWPEE